MTMTDAPGSLFGELVNLTRDSGQYPFLVTSLSPPSCTLPCSPNVHDADSFLLGIGYCKPVFGCTEVRCSFSGISSISVRPIDALGGLVACHVGNAWCGRTAVGLTVTPTAFNWRMDPTCFRL